MWNLIRGWIDKQSHVEIDWLRGRVERQHLALSTANRTVENKNGEIDALRVELEAVKSERDDALVRVDELDKELGEACATARKDQGINDCSVCGRETKNTGPCMVCLSEKHRAELDAVKADRDGYIESIGRYIVDCNALQSELAALRQPVPVKVRFECESESMSEFLYTEWASSQIAAIAWAEMSETNKNLVLCYASNSKKYLAAHAVIDAPAGVPSAEELAECICSIPDKNGNLPQRWLTRPKHEKEFLIRGATRIRDTVLAVAARENRDYLAATPTDAQVEGLARVIREAGAQDSDLPWEKVAYAYRDAARAVFAHFRQPATETGGVE